jgi:hypothetical protein
VTIEATYPDLGQAGIFRPVRHAGPQGQRTPSAGRMPEEESFEVNKLD